MARPKRYETAAQKQKAYRERKKLGGVPEEGNPEIREPHRTPTQPSTIEELRDFVKREEEKPHIWHPGAVGEPFPERKPIVYRNDYGAVISEAQWNRLQELKRQAKEGGYEIDEYSQT